MTNRVGRSFFRSAAATALLLASCGDGAATTTLADQTTAPAATPAPGPNTTLTTETPPPGTEQCEQPATEIALGSPITGEVVGPGERRYFCVQVPDGVSSITFELTENDL